MRIDSRLLQLARSGRTALTATILSGLLGGALTVWQAYLLSQVIGQVFLQGKTRSQVWELLAFLLVVVALRSALVWVSEVAANALAVRVKTNLRDVLLARLLGLGPVYSRQDESSSTGELVNTITEGVEALDAYFSQYLPQIALAALVPLTVLAFIFPLDPLSGLILLLTAPLIPLFMTLIGRSVESLTTKQWQRLNRLSAYFLDVLQGLTTLKILGRSREQAEKIADASERLRQATMNVLRVSFLSALTLELVTTLSTAVVAVSIGLRLLYSSPVGGSITFEKALFILLLAPEFYLPLRQLGARFHAGMAGVSAASSIFKVLELSPSSEAMPGSQPAPARPGRLSFQGVGFRYPDGRRGVEDLSFQVEAGQKLALVGPSGAGKSTIASLLLRFVAPTSGKITLDGVPIETVSPSEWRKLVAWVPQNPYLFNDSIAANIRLARPDSSLEQVKQAARLAQADGFISRLPQGYHTPVGERGARLSAGQAQRIVLARAFLKDAPIVILDEASSSLDPKTEADLQQVLSKLVVGRTLLVIAHRLSTVYQADQILVLSEGRIVESGVHSSLMAQRSLYHRLVTLNALSTPAIIPNQTDVSSPPSQPARLQQSDSLSPLLDDPACVPKRSLSPMLRLVSMLLPYGGLVTLSVLLGFATIASGIGLLSASAYLIASAALQPSIAELQVAIVGVRFFGISRGVFRYLERYISHLVVFKILAKMRRWFYQALEPLAPARLWQRRSGDLLSRIISDIASLENLYLRGVAPPIVALLVVLVVCLFFSYYHFTLALVLFVFHLLNAGGAPVLVGWLSRRAGRSLVHARSELNATLVDGIQGMADLVAYDQHERYLERMAAKGGVLGNFQKQMAVYNGMQAASSTFLANLGTWAVLAYAIPLVTQGSLPGVILSVLVLAALSSFEAALPLPQAAQQLESNAEAARRLFEIVDTPPEIVPPANPLPLPAKLDLVVHNLRFFYPVSEQQEERIFALDGVTFKLERGKKIAVVGPSGAGKSTLLHLILRFWEYEQGEISTGGVDIRMLDPEQWRKNISVVSQNTYLFNATIRDNLALARPDASQEEIHQAARLAQVHDFITALPQGYHTWVGEHGLRLSAGERQRLAIARALLQDAPLLILDEATANLDTLTEQAVLEAIHRLAQERTTLTITHRLVNMPEMDEILVFDHGRVVQRGRHLELLQAGGLYRQMWELQNQVLAELVNTPA